MHWLEFLLVVYFLIGGVIGLGLVFQGWCTGDPFTFVSYLLVAAFAPAFWGPIALIMLAWFILSGLIGFLMELTGVRRDPYY